MQNKAIHFILAIVLMSSSAFAQNGSQEFTVGHIFKVNLPDYMSRSGGLNDAASIQFQNNEKDVYGIIIIDSKEDMLLAGLDFPKISDFYADFIKGFLVDEKQRSVSSPTMKALNGKNYMETEASFYDPETKAEIYYYVGIAETPTTYYKVLCWCLTSNQNLFKADFQKILYSVND